MKLVDKNIDGLESDKDFSKMAQDVKKNDDGLNIAGLIGLPEHNKVQTCHKSLKRDTNGRWSSEKVHV